MIFQPGQAKALLAAGKLRIRYACTINGQKYMYGDPVPAGLSDHELANLLSVGYIEPTDRPLLQKPLVRSHHFIPQATVLPPLTTPPAIAVGVPSAMVAKPTQPVVPTATAVKPPVVPTFPPKK